MANTYQNSQATEQQYTPNTAVVTIDKMATTIGNQATTWISNSIAKGELTVPTGYNVGSEVALAMMKIAQTVDRNRRPAIQVCTKDSIITALREMAMKGLSMAQNQCYPIVYGDQLQIQRSYFGAIASLRRIFPQYDITATVVYKGDEYDYGYDEKTECYYVKLIKPYIKNRDLTKIELVFGTIKNKETGEVIFSEVMGMDEIKRSWKHAKTTNVHEEHPDQMAKRTLLNRMCKLFVNTYPLDPTLVYTYNQSVEDEYERPVQEEATVATNASAREYARRSSGGNEGLKEMLKTADVETVEDAPIVEVVTPTEEKPTEEATEEQSLEEAVEMIF